MSCRQCKPYFAVVFLCFVALALVMPCQGEGSEEALVWNENLLFSLAEGGIRLARVIKITPKPESVWHPGQLLFGLCKIYVQIPFFKLCAELSHVGCIPGRA